MKRALLMCAVAIPAVVASTMAAAVPGDEWYITPQVGGISPDHQRDLRHNDWLYGVALGREMGPFINMELNFNGARVNNGRATGHLDTYGYSHTHTLRAFALILASTEGGSRKRCGSQ